MGLIFSSSFFKPTRDGRQLNAGSRERVSVAERVLDMSVVITRRCGQSRGSDRARATVSCANKPALSPPCGAHFSPTGFRVSGSIPSSWRDTWSLCGDSPATARLGGLLSLKVKKVLVELRLLVFVQ